MARNTNRLRDRWGSGDITAVRDNHFESTIEVVVRGRGTAWRRGGVVLRATGGLRAQALNHQVNVRLGNRKVKRTYHGTAGQGRRAPLQRRKELQHDVTHPRRRLLPEPRDCTKGSNARTGSQECRRARGLGWNKCPGRHDEGQRRWRRRCRPEVSIRRSELTKQGYVGKHPSDLGKTWRERL